MTRKRSIAKRCVLLAVIVSIAAGVWLGYRKRHLGLAVIASWSHDWPSVRRHAEEHLESDPESRRALALLGRSFLEVGDGPAAEQAYGRLAALGRVPLADLHRLAQYYAARGQSAKEIGVRRRIDQLAPDEPDNLLYLARLSQEAHDTAAAAELFDRVTRLAPSRADAWEGLARLHLASRDPDQAVGDLERGIATNGPETWKLRRMLAGALLGTGGEVARAESELELVIKASPEDPHALWLMAQCVLQHRPPETGRAREYARRALASDPRNFQVLLLLARLCLADSDAPGASDYVAQALAAHPDDREALHLSRICQRLREGKSPKAGLAIEQLFTNQNVSVTWQFTDVAEQWGITFHHTSGENKQMRYYPESLGSGVALLDYDGDGWLDVYFVNSKYLMPDEAQKSLHPRNALFRNLGNGHFQDFSAQSGLDDDGFGHGAAVADYDNDGHADVYVTNYGPNVLYRNNGDGTFTNVTAAAGLGNGGMSTSAAWFDFDEDGDLDLYVCNYAEYDVANPVNCVVPGQGRIYCAPEAMPSQRDALYRNNGDGTFSEVASELGIARDGSQQTLGKGLGVVAADLNEDGHVDLFVANDNTDNFLFAGDGHGLRDVSETSGADRDKNGTAEACMGVDVGDVDGDGLPDLIVTNDWMEKNTLYRNEGALLFHDVSDLCGLEYATKRAVGWATALVDFDRDGDLDHFVSNGHYYDWQAAPFRQTPMLWANTGDGTFVDVSSEAGPYFQTPVVGRGAAFGDLDNDGDVDIVLNQWNTACAVLRNDTQTTGAWLRLQLVGVESNRDAVGAQVEVQVGSRLYVQQRKGGGSYLSSSDPRLLVGLGKAEVIDRLRIRWPRGKVQEFTALRANQGYRLVEGQQPVAEAVAP